MKKLFIAKTVKVLAAFCILFSAVACKNNVEQKPGPEKENPVQAQEKEVYVSLKAHDIKSHINAEAVAEKAAKADENRTLQPNTPALTDLRNIVFSAGPALTSLTEYETFDYYSDMEDQTVKLPYLTTSQSWYFTLTAEAKGCKYKAVIQEMLDEGNNTLDFALSFEDFKEGNGACEISVSFDGATQGDPSKVDIIYVGLYDMQGNEIRANTIPKSSFDDNSATIEFNSLAIGYYTLKLYLYSGNFLTPYNQLAFWSGLLLINDETTTSAPVTITYLNPIYTLTCDLKNEGDTITWDDNTPVPETVTPAVKELPKPIRSGYIFNGWYTEYNEGTGEYSSPLTFPIRQDLTLYAFWLSKTVTADNVAKTIAAIKFGTKEEPASIKVTEDITGDTISAIKTALGNNSSVYFAIDLSAATGLTSISDSAFDRAGNLVSIVLPDTITAIGKNAFSNCSALKSIDLPANVTSIAERTFYSCTALSSVTIPASLTSIDAKAFEECYSIETITLKAGNGNVNFVLDGGILYKLNEYDEISEIALIPHGAESVTIGSSETSTSPFADSFALPDQCFRRTNIQEITVGDNITNLPDRCFYSSNVKTINLGENVEEIHVDAFASTRELEIITVDEDNQYFTADADGVLLTKDGKRLIKYPAASSASTYVIPASVTCIQPEAFPNNMTTQTISFENPSGNWYKLAPNYVTNVDDINPAIVLLNGTKLSSEDLEDAKTLLENCRLYVIKVDMEAFYENTVTVDVYYDQKLNVSDYSYTSIDDSANIMAYKFHAVPGKDYTINCVNSQSHSRLSFTNFPDGLKYSYISIFDEDGNNIASADVDPSLEITAPSETVYIILKGNDSGLNCAFRVWKEKEASTGGVSLATDITVTENFDEATGNYTYRAADGFSRYTWFIDNNEVGDEIPTFVLIPSKYNRGAHTLYLEASIDGYTYTYTKQFFVQ